MHSSAKVIGRRQLSFGPRFARQKFSGEECNLAFVTNGNREKLPTLFLHGYPQSHWMWNKVAPILDPWVHFIAADLRGYGDSAKPPATTTHEPYSKRAMARDVVALLDHLDVSKFAVVGHDRGARVAHRLCLDYPDRVERAVFLDIVPTRVAFENVDRDLATAYFHWFFLSQPAPFPEQMIGANPQVFLRRLLESWSGSGLGIFEDQTLEEYMRCSSGADSIRAACEDYRAAASIDLVHDEADRHLKIRCPALVLWGCSTFVGRHYDVLQIWRECSSAAVLGRSLQCGHFLAEERPQETAELLMDFLSSL